MIINIFLRFRPDANNLNSNILIVLICLILTDSFSRSILGNITFILGCTAAGFSQLVLALLLVKIVLRTLHRQFTHPCHTTDLAGFNPRVRPPVSRLGRVSQMTSLGPESPSRA